MPSGTQLTVHERSQAAALHQAGHTVSHIAQQLKRSRKVIASYLRNPETYATRNKRLTDAKSLSRVLRDSLQLPISVSRTRAYLAGNVRLRYRKVKHAPPLTDRHKRARLEWARKHAGKGRKSLGAVLFTDEKKFNCDGPDGLQYYWHDLRREEQVLSRREHGGNGVMVWAGFCAHGKTNLLQITGRLNALAYVKMLEEDVLPWADDNMPITWTFQQDNAPAHAALLTKNWFPDQGIRVMDWPARSPDLNPIENLWGLLVREVYKENRQFTTSEDLLECITASWDRIAQNVMNNLIDSMHKRCLDVIARQGKAIDY